MKRSKGMILLQSVAAAYALTFLLTLLLAFVFYRFDVTKEKAAIAVLGVYLCANLLGGFIGGKLAVNRKFLVGLICGCIYVLLLLSASLIVNHGLAGSVAGVLTTIVLCVASGMFGGMIS